jgi:hypothetical protein
LKCQFEQSSERKHFSSDKDDIESERVPYDLMNIIKSKVYTGPNFHIKNEIQANNSMRVQRGQAPVGKVDISEICISITDV